MKLRKRSSGIVSVMAILMMAILVALAVSYAAVYNQNSLQSANLARAEAARMEAEGGVSFLLQHLWALQVPAGTYGSDLLNWLGTSLAARLNGTPNLGAAAVTTAGGTVTIPTITTDAALGRGFQATITMDSNSVVRVRVTGVNGAITRTAQICLNVTPSRSAVFNYGVAARGPILMKGSAALLGANNDREADLFTAAYVDVPVSLFGNVMLEGDISLSDPSGAVSLSQNAVVGGETGDDRWDHIHVGVGEVDFPEVNTGVFEPFATTIVDSRSSFSDANLSNIRIKAGTNPVFSGNTVIQGVVFIETPNKVKFTGNLWLTGVVVTQDAGHNNTANNTIDFAGTAYCAGVQSLPDQPQFAQLRTMPGTFLLAPGFETDFAGNFGMINGCMAAETFKFSGNTGGIIGGTIISYGDTTFTESGSSLLIINKAGAPQQPPGFSTKAKLVPDMDTYGE